MEPSCKKRWGKYNLFIVCGMLTWKYWTTYGERERISVGSRKYEYVTYKRKRGLVEKREPLKKQWRENQENVLLCSHQRVLDEFMTWKSSFFRELGLEGRGRRISRPWGNETSGYKMPIWGVLVKMVVLAGNWVKERIFLQWGDLVFFFYFESSQR